MIDARSSVNARLRTSITTATFVTAPCAFAPSSTIVEISSGGRLSTTNQPRSSRHLAAVLRPAPDRPVTTATSTPCAWSSGVSVMSLLSRLFGFVLILAPRAPLGRQRTVYQRSSVRADPRYTADVVH